MGRLAGLLVVMVLGALAGSPAAFAGSIYKFDVETNSLYDKRIYVKQVDSSKSSTVRVVRGGGEVSRLNTGSGQTVVQHSFAAQAGDVIEFYQPTADGANPPVAVPKETFTVPSVTVTPTVGSATVTGSFDGDGSVRLNRQRSCVRREDSIAASTAGGSFSGNFDDPVRAGEWIGATIVQPDGDRVFSGSWSGGEEPCIIASGFGNLTYGYPGPSWREGYPYDMAATGLNDQTISDVRVVLRRGATVLKDDTPIPPIDSTFNVWLTPNLQPLPGDTIDVYRPAAAGAPTTSWTIPGMSAVFDAGSDLIAFDGPAASFLQVTSCRVYDCIGFAVDELTNTKEGRTIVSLKEKGSQAFAFVSGFSSPPEESYDIRADDLVSVRWTSSDRRYTYSLGAVPGDLTPPAGRISSSRRMRIAKRMRIKVISNEAGKATVRLTTKVGGKTVIVAKATRKIKAGTNRITLKATKAGLKLSDRMNAVIEAVLKDAAGNKSTVTKKVKLRR